MEEIKEFKDKEAKIAAISKGNELIKKEVLVKLQQVKNKIENEEQRNVSAKNIVIEIDDSDALKRTQQRKRKISTEKVELKEETADNVSDNKKKELTNSNNKKTESNVKLFAYKNVDYKKFYNHSNKDHKQKQPKMKFKKYKN